MEKKRYADVLYDETFKIIFGHPANKELLMRLLECLIPTLRIADLSFGNSERHGLALSDKSVTFDLFCRSDDGRRFVVEMQYAPQPRFADRALCYATYPIREQLALKQREVRRKNLRRAVLLRSEREKMDYRLDPVYVVSIVNFALDHGSPDVLEDGLVSRYSLRDDRCGETMSDSLHFVFFEIGRMHLGIEEYGRCTTVLERLAFSLRYLPELDRRPDAFREEVLELLYEAAEHVKMTPKQRRRYDMHALKKLDILAQINYAEEKGQRLQAEATARAMMADGMPAETAAKYTGLTVDAVKAL